MLQERIMEIHGKLAIRRDVTVLRDEYLDYMTFVSNERPLFTEIFGPLLGLKEEWRAQGASEAEIDFSAFRFRAPGQVSLPIATGWINSEPDAIIEESEEYILGRDGYGRTVRLAKLAATLPLPLDYPVKNMDDWLAVKHHYEFSEFRFGNGWEEIARKGIENGRAVAVHIPGGFDEPRNLMGEEALCVAYHEQPELIHDMLDTFGDLAVKLFDRVTQAVTVDILDVHEDMAGKAGPLAGPRQVREFIAPYYKRVWDLMKSRGARIFSQDSDGDMTSVLPFMVDAGLNLIMPVEPVGGMDMVKLREQYGARLAFMGGLNKYAVMEGPEPIDREIEYKVPPLIKSGGCLFGLDHRIPAGVTLANYRYYHRRMWEIIGRLAK